MTKSNWKLQSPCSARDGLILAAIMAAALAPAACNEPPKQKRSNVSQNVGDLDTWGTVKTSNRAVIDSNAKSGSSGGH